MSKYIRNCDWCNEQLLGIENHTDKKYTCSNPVCPHDHGGYIRCDDVDTCRRKAVRFGGDPSHLNNIDARRFSLPIVTKNK